MTEYGSLCHKVIKGKDKIFDEEIEEIIHEWLIILQPLSLQITGEKTEVYISCMTQETVAFGCKTACKNHDYV